MYEDWLKLESITYKLNQLANTNKITLNNKECQYYSHWYIYLFWVKK